MGFNDLLRMMIEKDGSDLFLTTGAPPGKISYEEALKNADSKNNLRLKIQLAEGKTRDEEEDLEDEDESGGLSLVGKDDDSPMSF